LPAARAPWGLRESSAAKEQRADHERYSMGGAGYNTHCAPHLAIQEPGAADCVEDKDRERDRDDDGVRVADGVCDGVGVCDGDGRGGEATDARIVAPPPMIPMLRAAKITPATMQPTPEQSWFLYTRPMPTAAVGACTT